MSCHYTYVLDFARKNVPLSINNNNNELMYEIRQYECTHYTIQKQGNHLYSIIICDYLQFQYGS